MDLLILLEQLASHDKKVRVTAENAIYDMELEEGFAGKLLDVAKSDDIPLALRQLSTTLLKELVRKRWDDVIDSDKELIKLGLLGLVFVSNSSIRKLAHVTIGYVCNQVGLENWPALFDAISNSLMVSNVVLTDEMKLSVLDLWSVIIEESGGSALLKYVNRLCDYLLNIAEFHSSSNSEPVASSALCRKAFAVFVSFVVNLAQDEELEAVQAINFKPWLEVVSWLSRSSDIANIIFVLRGMKSLLDAEVWATTVSFDLIKVVVDESVVWLEKSRNIFESLIVNSEEGGIDEDEEQGGLVSLVVAIIELLNAVAINDISEKILRTRMEKIVLAIAPYLQISVSNEFEWVSNPNDFIANNEQSDAFTTAVNTRICFEGLLADCLDNPFVCSETMNAVVKVAVKLIREGMDAKQNGNNEYWRLVEAGLFMISFINLEDDEQNKISSEIKQYSSEIMQGCATFCLDQTIPDLLRSRAFLVLSIMAKSAQLHFPNDLVNIMIKAIECMHIRSESGPSVLTYAASKAFNAFLPLVYSRNKAETISLVMNVNGGALKSLAAMTVCGRDETLHYALESLMELTNICPEVVRLSGHEYLEFLKKLLVSHIDDPFVPDAILELVKLVHIAVDQREYDTVVDSFSGLVKNWLQPEAECKLDTSLEFIEYFVCTASVPFSGSLLECILVLNEGLLDTVGAETSSKISDIMQTCAVRLPADKLGSSSPMDP